MASLNLTQFWTKLFEQPPPPPPHPLLVAGILFTEYIHSFGVTLESSTGFNCTLYTTIYVYNHNSCQSIPTALFEIVVAAQFGASFRTKICRLLCTGWHDFNREDTQISTHLSTDVNLDPTVLHDYRNEKPEGHSLVTCSSFLQTKS